MEGGKVGKTCGINWSENLVIPPSLKVIIPLLEHFANKFKTASKISADPFEV